jgi:tetratricopeptide (TPR) repeat protein
MFLTRASFIYPLLLFSSATLLYFPSTFFQFTLDDPLVTMENSDIAVFRGDYLSLFRSSLYSDTAMAEGNENLYRPLLKVSMAVNYQLAGGTFNPAYFHAVNILLYALCAVAIFFLLERMFRSDRKNPGGMAFLGALLLQQREAGCVAAGHVAAPLLFFAALLSKESAILLLPVMLLWDYIGAHLRLQRPIRVPTYIYTLCAAIVAYLILRQQVLGHWLNPPETRAFFMDNEGLPFRLLTAARIFVDYYFWDQLIAFKLNPFFSSRFLLLDNPGSRLYPVLCLTGLVLLLVIAAWRLLKARSAAAFWILFFFCTSFLAAHVIPVGTGGAFRLMFTPSLGLCVLVLLGCRSAAESLRFRFNVSERSGHTVFVALVMAIVIFYGSRTLARMAIWQNDSALFSYSAQVEPQNPESHYAAGTCFGKVGRRAEQTAFYEKALNIFSRKREQRQLFTERTLEAFSVVATEIGFQKVLLDPSLAVRLSDLAIEQFERLQELRNGRLDTNIAAPYYVKALALKNLGRTEESIGVCREALALTPHRGIAQLLLSLTR